MKGSKSFHMQLTDEQVAIVQRLRHRTGKFLHQIVRDMLIELDNRKEPTMFEQQNTDTDLQERVARGWMKAVYYAMIEDGYADANEFVWDEMNNEDRAKVLLTAKHLVRIFPHIGQEIVL